MNIILNNKHSHFKMAVVVPMGLKIIFECMNIPGVYRGGDGVIRELVFRRTVQLSALTERRVFQPYGLNGKKYVGSTFEYIDTFRRVSKARPSGITETV